jgi:predicted glycosyltransferase involved in capsule biosynthesis
MLKDNIDAVFDNSMTNVKVSGVVCCMDRSDNLFKAIDSWLLIPEINEIILLDYGSKEKITLTDKYKNSIIKLYRVEASYWHLSRAYNIGIQLISNNVFLKLDADYCLSPDFLKCHLPLLLDKSFIRGISLRDHPPRPFSVGPITGFCMMSYSTFISVNGYNERIINYGHDDWDLYERLKKNNIKQIKANHNKIYHIPHPNHLRTINQKDNIEKKIANKKNIIESRRHPWTKKDKMSTLYE